MCVIPEVKGVMYDKLPFMPCKYLQPNGNGNKCAIYGSDERPDMCRQFVCGWMFGYGSDLDNPRFSKVMTSINEIDGETSIYVSELADGAADSTGQNIIMDMIEKTGLPVRMKSYGK